MGHNPDHDLDPDPKTDPDPKPDSTQRDACGAGERDDLAQHRLGLQLLRAGVRAPEEGRSLLA